MRLLVRALAMLVMVGCAPEDDGLLLEDSVGVTVPFDGSLMPTVDTPPALHCEGTMPVVATWGFGGAHIVALCPIGGTSRPAHECRPLVCERDADCPDGGDFEPIACEDGFCARTTEELRDTDVVIACVAEAPRNADCSDALAHSVMLSERVGTAIDRHCDGSGACTGPIVCGP